MEPSSRDIQSLTVTATEQDIADAVVAEEQLGPVGPVVAVVEEQLGPVGPVAAAAAAAIEAVEKLLMHYYPVVVAAAVAADCLQIRDQGQRH